MKRSEINKCIEDALTFLDANRFFLPPWARWTPQEWAAAGPECDEIRCNGLGWDLTDFGLGDFAKYGLTLVTIRNGSLAEGPKTYCEKIMIVRDGQVTPTHFHFSKTEDIINRGGGTLCMKLWWSDGDEKLTFEPIIVQVDGVTTRIEAGETFRLSPGASITYPPRLYHTFWAEGGDCLVGEVSTVNDDKSDNRFLEAPGRFPAIEEDEAARFLLCNEYPENEYPEKK